MLTYRVLQSDLLFLVDCVLPAHADREAAARSVRGDPHLIESLLDDERVFQRLMKDADVLSAVSPWLFFSILLRRTARDLAKEAFTVEMRSRQKVVLFDADQVITLLEQEPVREYLADMLASFTKVHSVTVRERVREGVWRRRRASELDVESMMRYAEGLAPAMRYAAYRRIADVCLFLAGVFPEHIPSQRRFPAAGGASMRSRHQLLTRLEDYEEHGRAIYRLAAEQEQAQVQRTEDILRTLSENFILAEKALNAMTKRYLTMTRAKLFHV